jgi:hypothetical protein
MLNELPKIDISKYITNNQAIKLCLRRCKWPTIEEVARLRLGADFAVLLLINKTDYYVCDQIDFVDVGTSKKEALKLFFHFCTKWYSSY